MKTTIVKMYLHKKEDIKVIDFTFSEKVVKMYRNNEVIDTDKLSLRVSEFRNNSCCGTRVKEISAAMDYLDCEHPLNQRYLNKIFLGAEVDVILTEVNAGDTLDNGEEAKKDMILKSMNVIDITSDAKEYINNVKGLRLDLAKDDVIRQMAEEELGL